MARTQVVTRIQAAKLSGAIASSGDIDCHNGIMFDGTYFYGVDDGAIRKFSSKIVNGVPVPDALVLQNTSVQAQAGVAHLGGGQAYGGFLYIAAENYTNVTTWDSMRIAKFRADDLTFVATFDISAQNHECSDLCIDPITDTIYVCTYPNGEKVYKYRFSAPGTYLGSIQLTKPLPLTQGISFKNGRLYLAEDTTKRIYWATTNGTVEDYVRLAGINQQGIDLYDNVLYALDDQGTLETIWCAPLTYARQPLNRILIPNGDFSKIPASNVSGTTSDNRWIDGSTGNPVYIPFAADSAFAWCTNNGADASSAKFERRNGVDTMRLSSVNAGKSMEVALYRDDTLADHVRYGIRATPGATYSLPFDLETELIGGDSNDGVFVAIRTFNIVGTNVSTITDLTNAPKIKTTTSKTSYVLNFTMPLTAVYWSPRMTLLSSSGAGTLNMNAWFSNMPYLIAT